MSGARRLANVGGLVLAGGRSTRFGADKAVAEYCGRPLLDLVAERFQGCAAVAVSVRPGSAAAERAAELKFSTVVDDSRHPNGPLAGVCAGLVWAQSRGFELLATAPCDTPAIPHDLVGRLVDAIADAPSAYAVTSAGAHPLCAIWRVSFEPTLARLLCSGRHPPVRQMLDASGAARVWFGDTAAFANANTAADLARLERTT